MIMSFIVYYGKASVVNYRSRISIAGLMLALPLVAACATTADHVSVARESLPRLLTASPDSRAGGEARFEGELQIRDNCVVVGLNQKDLPIFDPSVRLTETGDAIIDSKTGVRVGVGERFIASAAHFRSEGQGWSLSDIKEATGVAVPEGCGTDEIVRLGYIQKGTSR